MTYDCPPPVYPAYPDDKKYPVQDPPLADSVNLPNSIPVYDGPLATQPIATPIEIGGQTFNNSSLKSLMVDNNGRLFTTNGCNCTQRHVGHQQSQEEIFPVVAKLTGRVHFLNQEQYECNRRRHWSIVIVSIVLCFIWIIVMTSMMRGMYRHHY